MTTTYDLNLSMLTVTDGVESHQFSYELAETVVVFSRASYPEIDAPSRFAAVADAWFAAFAEALWRCRAVAAVRIANRHCDRLQSEGAL